MFGLPRITTCQANLQRIVDLVDSPSNGLTLCSGSLGANPANDIPAIIRHFGKQGRYTSAMSATSKSMRPVCLTNPRTKPPTVR